MLFPALDILNEDKTINRRCLGRKVFGNKVVDWHFMMFKSVDVIIWPPSDKVFVLQDRLKALTDIVWPEIALLVKQKIQRARVEGVYMAAF